MRLSGRALVAAMCAGQVGNLLPHVAVPAVMPKHLIPLWHLSGGEAGLMASRSLCGGRRGGTRAGAARLE